MGRIVSHPSGGLLADLPNCCALTALEALDEVVRFIGLSRKCYGTIITGVCQNVAFFPSGFSTLT